MPTNASIYFGGVMATTAFEMTMSEIGEHLRNTERRIRVRPSVPPVRATVQMALDALSGHRSDDCATLLRDAIRMLDGERAHDEGDGT